MSYPTPARELQQEIEVKKSRFIARVAKVSSRDEAMQMVDRAKADYPDARHHCWAYVIGNPAGACDGAMSDAGEPSGTAGKPILNVIQHKGIGDIMVVVIRYFGGIKLGAGGLTRAYSGATEAALSVLPLEQQRPECCLQLSLDFSREQLLRHWAQQHEARVESADYADKVTIRLSLPQEYFEELQAFSAAQQIEFVEE